MKNKIFILFVIALAVVSCNSNYVFDQYKALENSTWNQQKSIDFSFSVTDTISKNNAYINLRNTKDYAYSNLFLITRMNFPDGQSIVDTLEYDMADVTGKFLGEGFTDIKQNKLFYKENITFPVKGDYTFSVQQAMRKNGNIEGVTELTGITHVGFKIEKIN